MKNLILFFAVAVLVASSCKPIYRCGDPIPDKLSVSKRAQRVVLERDELCATVAERDIEVSDLQKDISKLKDEIADIERQYSELNNDKLSQAEQFSLALKQKSDELSEKERLLVERERALTELQQILAEQDQITRRLNDVLKNALLGFDSDELSVEIRDGKVYVSMSDRLLFRSGSAAVEAKGKEAIKVLAGVLNNNPDIDILVEGHTDNVPIKTAVYKDNWDLSVARATSIVRILTEDYKMTPTRLTASGKGEFSPRSSNATAEGRANNRRTEIILSPKLDEIMKLIRM
jgi:chemotaxis protein MotB